MSQALARRLPLVLLLTACGGGEPLGSESSFLRAEVSGAVQAKYVGTGEFWTGGDADLGQPPTFGINSRLSTTGSAEVVSLWTQRQGRPSVGSYELRHPNPAVASWHSFAAVYHHRQGGSVESYVAESGTLRITSSSAERVEGTFQFTGIRYCARSATERVGSCTPTVVDPMAPRVSISGSFVAVPADYKPELRSLRP